MNIRLIACIDSNNGIGLNNKLLYNLKDDLKRFSALTKGNVVVMGRKTFESLPNGPLPGRVNVVLSKTMKSGKGYLLYRTIEDFLIGNQRHPDIKDKKIYVIGGGEIYSQFLNHANYLDITLTDSCKIADTYFPVIDGKVWKIEATSDIIRQGDTLFKYITYQRKTLL